MLPLKYLSNSQRTLEMPLINCEINLYLNWFKIWFIVANNTDKDTTLSPSCNFINQDNTKLLEFLKFGFQRKINIQIS